jgi:micrococcal nuclease
VRTGRAAGLAVLALALVVAEAPAGTWFTGTVTRVPDGDTLWVRADEGGPPHRLRLDGIDAPEICQPGGQAAREALAQRILHHRVVVLQRRQDDYGRGLARIQLEAGGEDLGARMVREGWAWSYRYRDHPGIYAAEERQARAARRGLFADPQAERPRSFRLRHGSCHGDGP